jgi:hypothetical protein
MKECASTCTHKPTNGATLPQEGRDGVVIFVVEGEC